MKKKAGEEWYTHKSIYYGNKGFPLFGFILLMIGVIWLLQSIGIITPKIPWWPIIIILLGLWFIAQRYYR